tara:strand:- start:302 stop:580 length:279 start_codon:yes stop_codon:yes gene_type:complete
MEKIFWLIFVISSIILIIELLQSVNTCGIIPTESQASISPPKTKSPVNHTDTLQEEIIEDKKRNAILGLIMLFSAIGIFIIISFILWLNGII